MPSDLTFSFLLCYVQNMNDGERAEEFRVLRILEELSTGEPVSQRQLSKRVGIALGLVNSYLKNLIKKGYVTVKNIPPRRYAYYLTPKGFAEKSRLALRLLQDYTKVYRQARAALKELFRKLEEEGSRRVVFAGSDEVAEIAYLSIQETDLQLVGVVDDDNMDRNFFGIQIESLERINTMDYDYVVIVSYLKRENLKKALLKAGVEQRKIKKIFD